MPSPVGGGVGGEAEALVEEREQLLRVGEVVLVGAMLVAQANVEQAVAARHQAHGGEVLAESGEELTGEPHGPQRMPSGVAVLDLDLHVLSSR